MRADWKNVGQLYFWNKRVFSIGGIWPLEESIVKFYSSYVFFVVHFVMSVGDLVNVFGDLDLVLANLSETSVQFMFGVKMLILRYSKPLKEILKRVEAAESEENYFDETERSLYLEYNTIGRTFFRTGSYLALGTVLTFHFKPFEDIIKAVLQNETVPFILPYRMRLFFEMKDTRTYVLVYLSQSPMIYYYYSHTISVCFLCTLVVHVAGEMSVLAYRIKNINHSESHYDDLRTAFREIVIKHQMVIRNAENIDDIFNVVLLEELVISTMLIGLSAYSVLAKSGMVSMIEFLYFINVSMALITLIFVYCITGEFLQRESMNVNSAFYECQWYDMPSEYRKFMTICMARAQRPLELTAGKFYVFTLSRFSGVLKSSMAYISMLRTIV